MERRKRTAGRFCCPLIGAGGCCGRRRPDGGLVEWTERRPGSPARERTPCRPWPFAHALSTAQAQDGGHGFHGDQDWETGDPGSRLALERLAWNWDMMGTPWSACRGRDAQIGKSCSRFKTARRHAFSFPFPAPRGASTLQDTAHEPLLQSSS